MTRCGLAALALLACSACRAAEPELSPGLRWVRASADPLAWVESGWIAVVTPVRPPTTADRRAHIVVAVKPPAGGTLRAVIDAQGRAQLELPTGSSAARIEYDSEEGADAPVAAGWRVLDVRRFDWLEAGLRCTVLRPRAAGGLGGIEWACGNELDARAGQALVALGHQGLIAATARIAELNNCTSCHTPHRVEDRSEHARVQRATDGQGLFTLRSVLRDEDPIEIYRPINPNEADELLAPTCPAGGAVTGGRCLDGSRPRLRLDIKPGLARGDPHVRQLCDSRRALQAAAGEAEGLLGDCAD